MTTIFTTRLSTKTLVRVLAAALAVSGTGLATAQAPVMTTEYVAVARQNLQQVVAPIALYPDALLAQVLVASTYPQDVVTAAQWLRNGGDPLWTDFQNWDDSVKGLTHYPQALNLLADNYDWMNQLGAAFIYQRNDVMASVQDVRNRAWLNGQLASNQYQNVVAEQQVVQIIPANPQLIYVPVYQPQAIFVERPMFVEPAPFISFGIGIEVGSWLHHDCDWNDNAVYVGNWGSDRPWWHRDRDDRRDRDAFTYSHNRPGYFAAERNVTNVTNVRNVTNVSNIGNASRWQHDDRRQAPRPELRTAARPAMVPQRSVANASTIPGRIAPAVRDQVATVSHNTPSPRPVAQTAAVRPAATITDRPAVRPTPARETTPAVRPTPTRETAQAVRPTPSPASAVRPTVRPTPTTPTRETAPIARPAPAPTFTARPTVRPTPVRETAATVRPTPAPSVPTVRPAPASVVRPTPVPVVRPTPAPAVRPAPAPAVRPTPAPAVRPAPARETSPAVRPTPAPTRNPSTPPAARPANPTGRPTAPGTDTPNRDGSTNAPRGR